MTIWCLCELAEGMVPLIALCSLLLISTVSGCDVSFLPDQEVLILTPGQNVSVQCDARCPAPDGARSIQWFERRLVRGYAKRFTYKPVASTNSSANVLKFENAEADMAGTYVCFVPFLNGWYRFKPLRVTFQGVSRRTYSRNRGQTSTRDSNKYKNRIRNFENTNSAGEDQERLRYFGKTNKTKTRDFLGTRNRRSLCFGDVDECWWSMSRRYRWLDVENNWAPPKPMPVQSDAKTTTRALPEEQRPTQAASSASTVQTTVPASTVQTTVPASTVQTTVPLPIPKNETDEEGSSLTDGGGSGHTLPADVNPVVDNVMPGSDDSTEEQTLGNSTADLRPDNVNEDLIAGNEMDTIVDTLTNTHPKETNAGEPLQVSLSEVINSRIVPLEIQSLLFNKLITESISETAIVKAEISDLKQQLNHYGDKLDKLLQE